MELTVDRVEERRKGKEKVQSKYFYSNNKEYKMSLLMYMNSKTRLSIRLYVWYDV